MGLIREPLDVDFEVDPRPLTKEEREQISDYIKAYKTRHIQKKITAKHSVQSAKRKKVIV